MIFSGLTAALIIFSLSTRQLFSFYLWLFQLGVYYWSYVANDSYMDYVNSIQRSSLLYELFSKKSGAYSRFIGNYIFQVHSVTIITINIPLITLITDDIGTVALIPVV